MAQTIDPQLQVYLVCCNSNVFPPTGINYIALELDNSPMLAENDDFLIHE